MSLFSFFTKEKSGSVAKDRLKLVLIHDRTLLSPEKMERLKDELISVISRYLEVDKQSLNIEISPDGETGRETALVANIPIKTRKK